MTTRREETQRILGALDDVVEIYSVETSDELYRFVIRKHLDGAITLSQFKRKDDNTLFAFSNKRLQGAV